MRVVAEFVPTILKLYGRCNMISMELYCPGAYVNPLTPDGRGRTIAAFLVTQGSDLELSNVEMRRDMLNDLMSPRAVGYWLNDKGWLELVRKVGRIQLLRLTDPGLITCRNSISRGGDFPTEPALVERWRQAMLKGGRGAKKKVFAPLKQF
jgi:hypothetical protein